MNHTWLGTMSHPNWQHIYRSVIQVSHDSRHRYSSCRSKRAEFRSVRRLYYSWDKEHSNHFWRTSGVNKILFSMPTQSMVSIHVICCLDGRFEFGAKKIKEKKTLGFSSSLAIIDCCNHGLWLHPQTSAWMSGLALAFLFSSFVIYRFWVLYF